MQRGIFTGRLCGMSDLVDGSEAEDADAGPVTIYDIQAAEESKVRVRALPRLTQQALRLAWAAGPREFMISTLLQVIGGGGIVLLLLLGQQGLQALLDALEQGESLAEVAPWAIAIAAVAGIQSFVTAVQRERQQVLGELMQRHVEESVLEVSAAVDLLAFETPAFHNRVQRMRLTGPQALELVLGVSSLIRAAIGVVAVLVTLITIEPVLVLMVSFVFLPAWLLASRRGEALWRFFWRMTPRDRERQYLAGLLSDRDEAQGDPCVQPCSVLARATSVPLRRAHQRTPPSHCQAHVACTSGQRRHRRRTCHHASRRGVADLERQRTAIGSRCSRGWRGPRRRAPHHGRLCSGLACRIGTICRRLSCVRQAAAPGTDGTAA